MVSSSGSIASSSSQRNGVDTWAPGRARTDQAPKIVLCGAFWLKSTNTRRPRSSFHHAAVHQVGPAPLELPGHRDRGGAHLVGRPAGLEPDVDVDAAVAGRLRQAQDAELVEQRLHLARRLPDHRERRRPASGRGRCAARRRARGRPPVVGHTWKPRQPRLTAHSTWARSAATRASRGRAVRRAHDRRSAASRGGARAPASGRTTPRRRRGGTAAAAPGGRPWRPAGAVADGLVVADQVELGVAPLREEHLVGVGDQQLVPGRLHHDAVVGHEGGR